MVSVGVKKKASLILQSNVSKHINKIIPKISENNIFSKILIYFYCKKKNIKYNDNICKILQYYENEDLNCQNFPLRRTKIVLRTLINKFNTCKIKKCYLCTPVRKFIVERKTAETLINLNKK